MPTAAHTCKWLENHRYASMSSFLAQLCHWYTQCLIFAYPVSWWEILLSLLRGYGCATSWRCVLSLQESFVPLLCPVMFFSDITAGCSTSLSWLVLHVLLTFRTEGRQAIRIQDNSKDQFEIDLIKPWTPFILICSLDRYWPCCEFLS